MSVAPSRPRPSRFRWWQALLPLALLGLLLLLLVGRRPPPPEAVEAPAFNVSEVPPSAPAAPEPYVSKAEREERDRLSGPVAGLPGFIPDQGPAPRQDAALQDDPERLREKENVRKYDGAVQEELLKLREITRRYYRKEPVVREVDRAFGGLPRYMAVKAQYQKDHDPYAFVRGSVALPEVRKTIYKYALNADVWRVTAAMVLEGLKVKPPKPIYDECKHVVTQDAAVAPFVTELVRYMAPRAGSLLPQVMRPGQDIQPLQQLANDLNVTSLASVSASTAAARSVIVPGPR